MSRCEGWTRSSCGKAGVVVEIGLLQMRLADFYADAEEIEWDWRARSLTKVHDRCEIQQLDCRLSVKMMPARQDRRTLLGGFRRA